MKMHYIKRYLSGIYKIMNERICLKVNSCIVKFIFTLRSLGPHHHRPIYPLKPSSPNYITFQWISSSHIQAEIRLKLYCIMFELTIIFLYRNRNMYNKAINRTLYDTYIWRNALLRKIALLHMEININMKETQ